MKYIIEIEIDDMFESRSAIIEGKAIRGLNSLRRYRAKTNIKKIEPKPKAKAKPKAEAKPKAKESKSC